MFKNRLLKVLAMLMVLNILIIPLTSFFPQEQNKYTVHASGELVDIRFFNAFLVAIGITAFGVGNMSQSFSIPEIDMVALKDQFQATLDSDATKKTAWLNAQTDYLAGGVAKTMGAAELAKIGINDIYSEFLNYLKGVYPKTTDATLFSGTNYTISQTVTNQTVVNQIKNNHYQWYLFNSQYAEKYDSFNNGTYLTLKIEYISIYNGSSHTDYCDLFVYNNAIRFLIPDCRYHMSQELINRLSVIYQTYGIDLKLNSYNSSINVNTPTGYANIDTGDIVNSTDTTHAIIPTIPWIDTTVPVGTVVTPAIFAPYAGTVPIDIPLTIPIDPPIDDPVDPPADATLLGTVAAILAGLTPIAGFLEYILAGQVSLTDAIETGLTNVVDGIGDVAGTLTGGISSTLADIKTSISTLFDPPTETLNLDKLKNLNSVLFTKFPFSIPFDFMRMIGSFSGDPVAPVLKIPFDMSSFGGENTMLEFDLSQFDYIASICRQISFIGFVFFMLFNTRKLIWK